MDGVVVLKTGDYVCPYNPSHCVRPLRFQIHLIKCRKQHAATMRMFICPFNAKHHVPEAESKYHVARCPDKALVDAHERANEELRKSGVHGDTSTPGYLQSAHIMEAFHQEPDSQQGEERQVESSVYGRPGERQLGLSASRRPGQRQAEFLVSRRPASVTHVSIRSTEYEEVDPTPSTKNHFRWRSKNKAIEEDDYLDSPEFLAHHLNDPGEKVTDPHEINRVVKRKHQRRDSENWFQGNQNDCWDPVSPSGTNEDDIWWDYDSDPDYPENDVTKKGTTGSYNDPTSSTVMKSVPYPDRVFDVPESQSKSCITIDSVPYPDRNLRADKFSEFLAHQLQGHGEDASISHAGQQKRQHNPEKAKEITLETSPTPCLPAHAPKKPFDWDFDSTDDDCDDSDCWWGDSETEDANFCIQKASGHASATLSTRLEAAASNLDRNKQFQVNSGTLDLSVEGRMASDANVHFTKTGTDSKASASDACAPSVDRRMPTISRLRHIMAKTQLKSENQVICEAISKIEENDDDVDDVVFVKAVSKVESSKPGPSSDSVGIQARNGEVALSKGRGRAYILLQALKRSETRTPGRGGNGNSSMCA